MDVTEYLTTEYLCARFFRCLLDRTMEELNPINLRKIQLFLEIEPSAINEKDEFGETPLHYVLISDRYNSSIACFDVVRLLLDNGADVNYEGVQHNVTSVMTALEHKRDDAVIRILIEGGADVKKTDEFGTTCLCYALSNGYSMEVIKLILEAGCHAEACSTHDSVLECASDFPAEEGLFKNDGLLQEGVLDLLIEAGADVLRFGFQGQSPVCFALKAGAGVGDIQRLLGLGASLDACQKHASLWLCATNFKYETKEMMRMLSKDWGMPLKADVFELLRTAKAPVDTVNENGYTPLQLALLCCDYETRAIKLLIDLPGTDVSVKDENNRNLLHLAVENNLCKPSSVKLLIERGVKVDELNSRGQTPLCNYKCSLSVTKLLLESGSPVNTADLIGYTPLNNAVVSQSFNTFKLLLFHGARIKDAKDRDQDWLLLDALDRLLQEECREKLEILKLLLKHYFLEDLDFEIHHLISRRSNLGRTLIEELTSFANMCAREVQIMKSNNISANRSLFHFIKMRSFPTKIVADKSLSNNEFNRLLSVMFYNDLSQYFELISFTVGKSVMEIKLQELRVYSISNVTGFNCMNENIYLDYDSLSEMTQFLSSADLLNLILAYDQENHVYRNHDTEGSGKRSPDQSATSFQKRQKLNE